MASYQDANNKRKEELKKALQVQKQMLEYQKNKESLVSKGNRYRQKIGQLGKAMSNSQNQKVADIGNKMYKFSGEQGIDKAKTLNVNQVKTGFNNLKTKLGLGAGATTGAGATASSVGAGAGSTALQSAIASNVAGTAGTTAGAGSSALTSGIASAAPSATSALGAGGAAAGGSSAAAGIGAGASTGAGASAGAGAAAGSSAATGAAAGASAVPVVGWIVAAAILAANAINSANNRKKMRALQVSNEATMKGQQEALKTKSDAMQGLEQKQNQNDAIDAEQAKADAIKQQTLDEFSQLMSNNQIEHDSTPLNSVSNLSDTNSSVEQKPGLNDVVEPVEDNHSILSKEIINSTKPEVDYSSILNNALSEQPNNTEGLTGGAANFVTEEKSEIPTNLTEQSTVDDKQSKISELFGEFKKGYEENRKNGFKPENLEKTDKSGATRVGEAVGTSARVLSNPITQGLIAGTIVGARNNDWGDGLEYGINWAQNKAKSDMYNRAITGEDVAPVIGRGLTSQDYNAHTLNNYRDAMIDNNKRKVQAQLDKTNPTMQAYADSMLYSKKWDDKKYNEFLNNPNFKPENRISLESIKTADNTAKVESDANYKGTMAGVAQQNANTNAGKLDETIRHNYATEGIAIDKNRITEAFNNVKANLKQMELNIKAQNPSGGMTAGQQIIAAKTIRDATVNMINNTDLTNEEKAKLIYEANYELIKTLRNLGMSKKVISATTGIPEEQIEQVIPSGDNDPLGLFDEQQQFEVINL